MFIRPFLGFITPFFSILDLRLIDADGKSSKHIISKGGEQWWWIPWDPNPQKITRKNTSKPIKSGVVGPPWKNCFLGPKKNTLSVFLLGGMHQPVWVIVQSKPIWVKLAIRLYKYFYASGKSWYHWLIYVWIWLLLLLLLLLLFFFFFFFFFFFLVSFVYPFIHPSSILL